MSYTRRANCRPATNILRASPLEHPTHKLYPAVAHEFFGMGAVIDEAEQAETFAAEQFKIAFTH